MAKQQGKAATPHYGTFESKYVTGNNNAAICLVKKFRGTENPVHPIKSGNAIEFDIAEDVHGPYLLSDEFRADVESLETLLSSVQEVQSLLAPQSKPASQGATGKGGQRGKNSPKLQLDDAQKDSLRTALAGLRKGKDYQSAPDRAPSGSKGAMENELVAHLLKEMDKSATKVQIANLRKELSGK